MRLTACWLRHWCLGEEVYFVVTESYESEYRGKTKKSENLDFYNSNATNKNITFPLENVSASVGFSIETLTEGIKHMKIDNNQYY